MNVKAVTKHITSWLFEYNGNAGTKGFVIGISGGVDSALTSTLAAKTGLPVVCVSMPIHQHSKQLNLANQHIEMLLERYENVSTVSTDLTKVFDELTGDMPKIENEELQFLTMANTRARLRMTTLYYYAGIYSSLVLGTGNKIEDFGVGFYTKYGDGGVDISPIADLVKSEVFELAKYVGVTDEILNTPPTDGLWGDDRTDEDQLGAAYTELEWAMNYCALNPIEKRGKVLTDRQLEVLEIYTRLNRINQHKMIPIPVCNIPVGLK